MDTATLIQVDAVLRAGSIRAAASQLGRPPASVAAAMARIEAELAVPLVRRAGSRLMLTLEGTRLAQPLEALAGLVTALFAPVDGGPQATAALLARRMVSLAALSRLSRVADAGSIRAAARALGLGQPQLTRQIAHVEAALGYRILVRAPEGAVPTPAGAVAIETIRRIEELWRDLANASSERFRRTETVVRIGSVVPLGPDSQIADLLAELAARWRKAHPRQPIFMTSMIAEELLSSLRRGLFDVVLLDVDSLPDDLDGRLISVSPLALIGGADLVDAPAGEAVQADFAAPLQRNPVAIPSLRSGLRQKIDIVLDDLLGGEGRKRMEIVEIDSIPVILKLVSRHGFVSILPSVSLTALPAGLRQVAFTPAYSLPLWIAWPKKTAENGIPHQVLSLVVP